jgi:hypothetical protein
MVAYMQPAAEHQDGGPLEKHEDEGEGSETNMNLNVEIQRLIRRRN